MPFIFFQQEKYKLISNIYTYTALTFTFSTGPGYDKINKTKKEEPNSFNITFPFHNVLDFTFLQLHLKRLNWRDYLKKANPAAAALLACTDYRKEEKEQLKLEFFKAILRLKLDPARMQLIIGFFDSYVKLTSQEEERVQQKLAKELPPGEVKEMTEILTSYHLRGMEKGIEKGLQKGIEKGNITALQRTLVKQVKKKLGHIGRETEKIITDTTDIARLEKALEFIFDLDSEETLLNLLNNNN